MQSKERENRVKIWVLAVAVMLVCALALTFTACSLFTGALGFNFGKTTTTTENGSSSGGSAEGGSEEGGSGSGQNGGKEEGGEQGGSGNDQGSGGDQGSGNGENGSGNDEGGEQGGGQGEGQTSVGAVTITSSLTYDKKVGGDLTITATHPNSEYVKIIGMGVTSANSTMLKSLWGSSQVRINGSYLSTLDAGDYDFYYAVADGYDKMSYNAFTLSVVNSVAAPTDLKIDYDIAHPSVYVTWHCDCGGKHSVSFDGGASSEVAEGVSEYLVPTSVAKINAHTASVRCVSSGKSASTSKAAPVINVVSGSYLTETFSFMGKVADCYVEDLDEMIFAYQYLAYEGAETSLNVAFSKDVTDEVQADLDGYLSQVNSRLVVPWSFSIGITAMENTATLKVQKVGGGNTISSGYTDGITYDPSACLLHYEEHSPRAKLPIDDKPAATVRTVKELLAAVEAGYKPVAEGDTLALYNKAREICAKYITDDMTELEKLHVIYDYLAGEITYDDSTLALYQLIAEIQSMSLADARAYIVEELATNEEFSSAMKTEIAERSTAADTIETLFSSLYGNYMQKLTAFSAEGVFNDKTAVCEGISYAFMLLAHIEGIECVQVTGDATNNGSTVAHAWNKVRLQEDGKWYCIDATWGNTEFEGERFVTHRYFMLDEARFYSTHKEKISSAYGVEQLAIGEYDYYASVITAEGHSLYVKNYGDLYAAIAYFTGGESKYIEIRVADSYTAYADDLQGIIGSYTFAPRSEDGIYLVYDK